MKLFRVLVKAEADQSGTRFKCAVLIAAQDLKICRFCDGLFISQEKSTPTGLSANLAENRNFETFIQREIWNLNGL